MKFVVIGGTGLIGSKLVTRTPAIATESPMLAAAREVTASVYQAGSSTASTRQGCGCRRRGEPGWATRAT
jgi:uncharacterized protein YbjT (DUF2867 family)